MLVFSFSPFSPSLLLITFQTSQCDSRGVPRWEAVDALAAYLVDLNRTITALSVKEEAAIVQLYTALHAMDKAPSKYKIVIILSTRINHTFHGTNEAFRYTQKAKKKAHASEGPWRASRKPSGSAPGQQAAERCLTTICYHFGSLQIID